MSNTKVEIEKLQVQVEELQAQIEQLKAEEGAREEEPRDNLMGWWAHHEKHGNVLIACQHADERGELFVMCPDDEFPDGADGRFVDQRELTFPEQTTRPEDVPVGEAWLVDADDGYDSTTNAPAVKEHTGLWITGENTKGAETSWTDHEVTLITPLIPARPHDKPQIVTTQEEYAALPEGSVVAKPGEDPWTRNYVWEQVGATVDDVVLAGTTRHILRRGRGE